MSPYQKFLASVKEFFGSYPALKVIYSLYLVIFASGGFLFLVGQFIGILFDPFTCVGTILMLIGLLLTLFNEDMLALVITSGVIALGSSVAWILSLAGTLYYGVLVFRLTSLFYLGLFGFIAIFTAIKSKKFHESLSAMSKPSGIPCPNCGATIVPGAAFCPKCGTPAPAPAPYAPPAPAQYAPPVAPQYAPPAAPQYAPPQAPPQYTPQAAPQYAPPAPPQPAPQPAPVPQSAPEAPAAPAEPSAAPAMTNCVNCGAELPVGAVFCGKCGAKQQ